MNDEKTEVQVELSAPAHAGPVLTSAQKRYYDSANCAEARRALQKLVDSDSYNTESTYFSQGTLLFLERHLRYLSSHPTTNLPGYISNLKLMTRKSGHN